LIAHQLISLSDPIDKRRQNNQKGKKNKRFQLMNHDMKDERCMHLP